MFTNNENKALADIYTAMLEAKKEQEKAVEVEVDDESEVSDTTDSKSQSDDPAADNTPAKKRKEEEDQSEALDPVGKADADIDNDGDVDSSDEYLHKRRKAIKKAMKESFADRAAARENALKQKLMEAVGDRKLSEEELEMFARRLGMQVADVKKLLKHPTEDMTESVELEEGKGFEVQYIQGMSSTVKTKKFKTEKAFEKWLDKNEGNVEVMAFRDLDESVELDENWATKAMMGKSPLKKKYQAPKHDEEDRAKRIKKKMYGNMMGGLKEDWDEQLEEILTQMVEEGYSEEEINDCLIEADIVSADRKVTSKRDPRTGKMTWTKVPAKRQKSIASESVELDEISNATKASYLKKADKDSYDMFTGKKPASKEKMDKRRAGIQKVSKDLEGKKRLSDFDPKTKKYTREEVELDEASRGESKAGAALKAALKSFDSSDHRHLQVLAGKLDNFAATGNRGMIADIVNALAYMDTDPREHALDVIEKADKAMFKTIMVKLSKKMNEAVELDEAAPKWRQISKHEFTKRLNAMGDRHGIDYTQSIKKDGTWFSKKGHQTIKWKKNPMSRDGHDMHVMESVEIEEATMADIKKEIQAKLDGMSDAELKAAVKKQKTTRPMDHNRGMIAMDVMNAEMKKRGLK